MEKIVFFINSLWSWGSNKVWVDLSIWLQNHYNTSLITLYWGKAWFFCKNHVKLCTTQSSGIIKKIVSLFHWYFSLKRYLKEHSIDIIFTFSMETTLLALLIKCLNRWWNAKIIMTQHENMTFINDYTALGWKIYKLFLYAIKALERYLDKIVCVSENTQKTLLDFWFSLKKIKIIYSGLNSLELEKKSKEDLEETTPFVLHIGNISKIKNQLLLIESFAKISDKIPHDIIFLWAVSDQKYYQQLKEKISELALEDRIRFLWFKKNPYKYLKNASILSSSSFSESYWLNILEALYFWIPVVSTAHEWWKEILNNWEYGILTWFSVEEYASWLLQLLLNVELYGKYTKKGKERANFFSQERQIKEYISLIESINV